MHCGLQEIGWDEVYPKEGSYDMGCCQPTITAATGRRNAGERKTEQTDRGKCNEATDPRAIVTLRARADEGPCDADKQSPTQ